MCLIGFAAHTCLNGVVVAQSVGSGAEERRALGSSPGAHKTWRMFWYGGGARTSLEHCCGTLEQGSEPTNAHIEGTGN